MNQETKEMLISQAKFTLKQAGYFVDNLWHIDDIKSRFECENNQQAQELLYNALTNEWVMEQIWYSIDMVCQEENLEVKTDEL